MPELLLCFLLPLAWARASRRITAGGAVLLCYLMAAREQPLAIHRVMPQIPAVVDLSLWLAHAACLTLPWLLAWQAPHQPAQRRAVAFLAALLLGLLPPWGLLGWLHPLTLSGWLYPAWGWVGLAATMALLLSLILDAARATHGLAFAAIIANALYRPAPCPPDWVALESQLPRMAADALSRMKRQEVLMAEVEKQLAAAPSVVLLPEEIAGPWTAAEAYWWQSTFAAARRRGVTLILGAQRSDPIGLRNGALIVAPGSTRWQLARQPIPLAEWNPLGAHATPAGWLTTRGELNSGITRIAGMPVLFSFCYEDLLTLPMLVSATLGPTPQVIVSMANLWWTQGMREPQVQQGMVQGWGRLWGVPVVRAVNGPA